MEKLYLKNTLVFLLSHYNNKRQIMDENLKKELELINKKLDKIYKSSEKTRKYFLAFLIITLAGLLLPMVGLIFAIPKFIGIYTQMLNM